MKYGYARVSTTDQKLENQIKQLKDAGAEKIFKEKFTGTTTKRPEFKKLIALLNTDDELIVTKLVLYYTLLKIYLIKYLVKFRYVLTRLLN